MAGSDNPKEGIVGERLMMNDDGYWDDYS